ncbi:plasmid mobilization protein [Alteromonas stellipolaris]|uniref:plasmid mobilization protein n=1 Tax=Alteromonas stellipolaris TaxID=233316 RepID=UPI0024956504|nr:hypothetical protein [Alteromonas stellipolaris]
MKRKPNNPATKTLNFRATEYDAERFQAQALLRDMSFSDYAREALLNFDRYQNFEDLLTALEARLIKRLFVLNSAIAGLSDAEIVESSNRYKELLKRKGQQS